MQEIEARINKALVGRSHELECFARQFDRVLEGEMGLSVVTGKPGTGKTFFVEHAAGLCNATYVNGKFKQYDQAQLVALAEIIEQIIRHILTLPTISLSNIRNDLRQRLGPDSGILLSICPYAETLLGEQRAIRADNLEQLQHRVRGAIGTFLEIASTALHPLIIFIDDLQWADTLSRSVIHALCTSGGDTLNLHLVLAHRDDEERADLDLVKLSKEAGGFVTLRDLSDKDSSLLIRSVFDSDIEHAEYLARILYGLTLGNPFKMSRVLRLFLRDGILFHSPAIRNWRIQLDRIASLNLPIDIEQLIREQVDGLTWEGKRLLELIACCGGVIRFEVLQALTATDDFLLHRQLEHMCQIPLLRKDALDTSSHTGHTYSVVHDIILKLILERLEPEQRSEIHFHIAVTLMDKKEKLSPSSRLNIAAHLLRVDRDVLKQNQSRKWTDELYQAGVAARQTTAVEQALAIFQCCAELTCAIGANENNSLAFSVRLALAECQSVCGQVNEAKSGFEALLAMYPDSENQIAVKREYIKLFAFAGDYEKVIEIGTGILAHLDFELNPRFLVAVLIESRLVFSLKKIGRLVSAPDITDQRLLYILETLSLLLPSANHVGGKILPLIILKMAILSARHGNSDYAPIAYASYAYVFFHVFKDHRRGKLLEDASLTLIDRCENTASKYVALCILGSITYHWTHSLQDTAVYLEQSIAEGEKADASLYSSYAITYTLITKYITGVPLSGLREFIKDCQTKQKRVEHYLATCVYDIFHDRMRLLERGSAATEGVFPEQLNEHERLYNDTIAQIDAMFSLQRLYLEGKMEQAYRLAEEIGPKVTLRKGLLLNVEILFFSILVRIAMHQVLSGAEEGRNRKLIKKHLRELRYWVRVYPGNHRARYLLAQAEYDALFASGKVSESLYREAMSLAEEQGNLSLEALANLLTAKFHGDSPKLSKFYSGEAARLFKQWGATYISDLVAGDMGLVVDNAPSLPVQRGSDHPAHQFRSQDILYHLGQVEEMDEDEGYMYLLNLLAQQGAVDYSAVLFEKSGEMFLKYDRRRDDQAQELQDLLNMNHVSSLPHKLIRYVARTETEIIINHDSPRDIFAQDAYIISREKLSLACLPIKHMGVSSGIIYLEKTGDEGLSDNLLPLVKGFLPSLLAKRTESREADLKGHILSSLDKRPLFTARELEVMKLLAEGLSNSEISKKLYISLGTVRNHLSSIYSKLEVDSRVKAVIRATELQIIQL